MWNYFPDVLMPFVKYTPTKEHRHIRHTTRVFMEVAGQVLDELTGDVSEKEGKKDVMSILGELPRYPSDVIEGVFNTSPIPSQSQRVREPQHPAYIHRDDRTNAKSHIRRPRNNGEHSFVDALGAGEAP